MFESRWAVFFKDEMTDPREAITNQGKQPEYIELLQNHAGCKKGDHATGADNMQATRRAVLMFT